jgi:hypothetical protein
MPKLYSYIRFSHSAQAFGDSVRRQTVKTAKWAIENGYELDEALTFRDLGVSAFDRTNLHRGALGLFLAAAREGKVPEGSILAIEALDRLTRAEPMDAFQLLRDITKLGIGIVTVGDGRLYDNTTLNKDLTSLMLAAVMLVRGHEESVRKSDMLKDHYIDRRATGAGRIGHTAPAWIVRNGDGWALHPEHSKTVLDIFEGAAKGLGATVLAKRFNEEKREQMSNRPGVGWQPGRISKILRNKSAIGEYQPHIMDGEVMVPTGAPLKNHYPVAVPAELFWAVQALLTERAPKGRRTDGGYRNIFSGILRCGYCDETMTLDKKGGQDVIKFFYFRCTCSSIGLTLCESAVNYKTLLFGAPARESGRFQHPLRLSLLAGLLEHLYMRGHNPLEQSKREKLSTSIAALETQVIDSEIRKKRLLDALESGAVELAEIAPRMDVLRLENTKLRTDMTQLQLQLASSGRESDAWVLDAVENEMPALITLLNDFSDIDGRAQLRTRLQRVLNRIYLYKDCAIVQLKESDVLSTIPLLDKFDMNDLPTLPKPRTRSRRGKS